MPIWRADADLVDLQHFDIGDPWRCIASYNSRRKVTVGPYAGDKVGDFNHLASIAGTQSYVFASKQYESAWRDQIRARRTDPRPTIRHRLLSWLGR